jgi:hypothetical protein
MEQKNIVFSRVWEMPNKNTFDVKCIGNFVKKYIKDKEVTIDPFSNKSRLAKITNDLDPDMNCDYCMDALEFLQQFSDNSIDLVLFDPPFSSRQISECYKRLGRSVNMETTQSSFWSKLKNEISRITKKDGVVLCFGWNSNGIGKTRGFELIEIMNVAHGGHHNDTICTAEIKTK